MPGSNTPFSFFQAEDGIRDPLVTGVQTCALPISSAAAVSVARTDPFPFAGEEPLLCGANAVIAAAAMCLQIRPSCAVRTWKSGQVQEPLPCGSSLTL